MGTGDDDLCAQVENGENPVPPGAPAGLPPLERGAHEGPADGMCLMEYISLTTGDRFSDRPRCTHPALAALARRVNDRMSDRARPWLARLEPALRGTNTSCPRASEAVVAACARRGLDLAPDDRFLHRALAAAQRHGSIVGHGPGDRCSGHPAPSRGVGRRLRRRQEAYRTDVALLTIVHRIVLATGLPADATNAHRDAVLIELLADVVDAHRRHCPDLDPVDVDREWRRAAQPGRRSVTGKPYSARRRSATSER